MTKDSQDYLLIFPIVVPTLIAILWIIALINIPSSSNKKEETTKSSSKPEKDEKDDVKTKFKVGDLVTGARGNPGDYEVLYPGCVCRVLEVDSEDEDMNVILVDHIDKEAHKKDIGETRVVPWENFTLIKKQKKSVKKPAKKKGKK